MIISGKNAVTEAILSGAEGIEKIYISFGTSSPAISEIKKLANQYGIPVSVADKKKFAELEKRSSATGRTQGIIALMSEVEYADIAEILDKTLTNGKLPLFIALDGITDPHNLGAVIRSAECAGCNAVIYSKKDSVGVNETVLRTSAGAAKHIPICRVDKLLNTLRYLKEMGVQLVGLSEHCKNDYTKFNFNSPVCLVVGSEGEGFTQQIKMECDKLLRINLLGKINSLNASVAASVVMFEAQRQRNL